VFEGGKVTGGKNKVSQQREGPWHPLSSGRPRFPAVCCSLLEIGSTFPKSLRGIMNPKQWGLADFLPGLAWNFRPPNLCFLCTPTNPFSEFPVHQALFTMLN
jgi:hypothetical protein